MKLKELIVKLRELEEKGMGDYDIFVAVDTPGNYHICECGRAYDNDELLEYCKTDKEIVIGGRAGEY